MEKTKIRESAGGGRTWPAGRHSRPPARPCPGPPSAAARPLPLTSVSPSRPGAASGRREATLKTGLCFRTSGHVRPSRGARRAGRGRPSRPAARRPPASGPHTKPSRPAAPRWLTPSGPPARPRRRPRPSPPRRGGTWPSHSDTSCKASLENAAGSFALSLSPARTLQNPEPVTCRVRCPPSFASPGNDFRHLRTCHCACTWDVAEPAGVSLINTLWAHDLLVKESPSCMVTTRLFCLFHKDNTRRVEMDSRPPMILSTNLVTTWKRKKASRVNHVGSGAALPISVAEARTVPCTVKTAAFTLSQPGPRPAKRGRRVLEPRLS